MRTNIFFWKEIQLYVIEPWHGKWYLSFYNLISSKYFSSCIKKRIIPDESVIIGIQLVEFPARPALSLLYL